jgi:hypothetical protein
MWTIKGKTNNVLKVWATICVRQLINYAMKDT